MISTTQHCCAVCFMNALVLLVVLVYYLSTPCSQTANAILVDFHKVLKTFNRHLNHKRSFTKGTGNTLHIHF